VLGACTLGADMTLSGGRKLGRLGMLGGAESVCDDATLMAPGRGTIDLPLAIAIESRMPPFLSLVRGSSKSGSGFGNWVCDDIPDCAPGTISGTSCCECAKKDRAVSQT
jgi:hypothetical protein